MKKLKRAKLIYNPSSGEGKAGYHLETIFRMYQKYGFTVDVVRLDQHMEEQDIFPEPKDYYDHFLIAGGDGTVDTMVNEMKKRGLDVPIGILPTGTANDYAHYIGMPPSIEECLRQILTLPEQSMDVGMANDRYFVNVFSGGHFTDISQRTDKDLKNSIGILAYFLKSVEMLRDFRSVKVRITANGRVIEDDMLLLMVFNGVYVGNMRIALKARGNDGLLDVMVFKGKSLNALVPSILRLIRGDESTLKDSQILWFQTDELTVVPQEPIPSDVDGEKGPEFPVHIRCIPDAIRVLGVSGRI